MATPTTHPFLYVPRWAGIDAPGISAQMKYILEERDRELEDYLGSLSASSAAGEQPSISVSRSTDYTGTAATEAVSFVTTDWADTGAHVGTANGKTCVIFDTPGRWWVTTYLEITDQSDGQTYPFLAHGRSTTYLRLVHGSVAVDSIVTGQVGNLAGGFVVEVLTDDYIHAGGQFFGGVSPGFIAEAVSTRPSLLQAFLLKAT